MINLSTKNKKVLFLAKKDYKAIYPFISSVGFSYIFINQAFNQKT
ncbi:hypothetical protein DB42_DB00140 [Neochlamydia sp. EPS4]|nr:hypothetical protein DB42_DB00140 [Neochlamydia sp. EPS4]